MSKKYEISDIKKAIKGSGAIISTIAKKLNCEWHTAKKYIEAHEETKKALKDEKEGMLDFAESMLMKNIQEQDTTSIIFYLKTKGKKRGYTEKQEIDHKVKNETVIKWGDQELKV